MMEPNCQIEQREFQSKTRHRPRSLEDAGNGCRSPATNEQGDAAVVHAQFPTHIGSNGSSRIYDTVPRLPHCLQNQWSWHWKWQTYNNCVLWSVIDCKKWIPARAWHRAKCCLLQNILQTTGTTTCPDRATGNTPNSLQANLRVLSQVFDELYKQLKQYSSQSTE